MGEKNQSYITVIPIYKERLSEDEASCVRRYVKVLQGTPMAFLAPEHMDCSWYEEQFPTVGYEKFADRYFTGTKSYNHLMLWEGFYQRFLDNGYAYMLVAQTDAVIWQEENRIPEFMEKGFDYYGAPWVPERRIWEWTFEKKTGFPGFAIKCCKKEGQGITMGNGGFSLRNIEKCIQLIHEFRFRKIYWFIKRNEDIFFGVFGRKNRCGFRLATVECGLEFAREYHLRECVEKGEIPFGVHGWQKDFSNYREMEEFLQGHGVTFRTEE